MQYRSVTSLAIMALASTAVAQQARVFTRASQSVNDFGVFGRQAEGYKPEDEVCGGEGSTCAEACGTGYEQCSSSDSSIHCYNPAAAESCCPSGDGSSCLASFYCSRSTDVLTYCCPNGSTLEQCATEFGVKGGLVSDVASAPASSSTPAPEPSSSSAPSSSEAAYALPSSAVVSSAAPSSGFYSAIGGGNGTSTEPTYALPSPTSSGANEPGATSGVPSSGGNDESAAVAQAPVAVGLVAAVAMVAALF